MGSQMGQEILETPEFPGTAAVSEQDDRQRTFDGCRRGEVGRTGDGITGEVLVFDDLSLEGALASVFECDAVDGLRVSCGCDEEREEQGKDFFHSRCLFCPNLRDNPERNVRGGL